MTPCRVIVADPPWAPRDKLPGPMRGAARQYAVMTTPEICAFPLPPIADDAVLFLWRLSSMVQDALDVATAWRFPPKSEVVWLKLTTTGLPWFGMGRTVRAAHETCLIGIRGRASRVIRSHSVRSTFAAQVPAVGGHYVHSAKPDAFFEEVVEPLVAGPYVELFARRPRAGWTQYGDELPPEFGA